MPGSIVLAVSQTTPRTRNVTVVDNSHVARRIGERIRQVRTRLSLTQAQLAKGRYTAAYISALERGLAKPSMAALTFLSERLGVSIPDLVAEERPAAGRLEADLLLAFGQAAAGSGPIRRAARRWHERPLAASRSTPICGSGLRAGLGSLHAIRCAPRRTRTPRRSRLMAPAP